MERLHCFGACFLNGKSVHPVFDCPLGNPSLLFSSLFAMDIAVKKVLKSRRLRRCALKSNEIFEYLFCILYELSNCAITDRRGFVFVMLLV